MSLNPIVFAAALIAATSVASSAQTRVTRPPPPTRPALESACSPLSGESTTEQLATKISNAQISYLHSRSKEDYIGTYSRQCENVVYEALERLAKLKSPAAAEAIGKLASDPELNWRFADRARLLTAIASGMGEMVLPYLRPHTKQSLLALEGVNCISQGYDSCM